MYAVICSPQFWKQIEDVVSSKGEEILFQSIDKDIDIGTEMEKIGRISVRHLIIDITPIQDDKKFIHAIRRFRIINDKTQIIIIAPNCQPGNALIKNLVTMGIYDIIAPAGEKEEEITISNLLIDALDNPSPYKKAVKWDVQCDDELSGTDESKKQSKEQSKSKVIIRKEIERVNVFELPEDYKKIIGITGISNSGKSTICLYSSLLFKEKRVALIDLSENQDLSFYFEEEDMSQNRIDINKNVSLFFNVQAADDEDPLLFLDILKEEFDLIIIDLGNNLENKFIKYIDNFYIVCDNDLSNWQELNYYLNKMKTLKIHYRKIKIIFNKVIVDRYLKTINDLSRYDKNNNLELIYNEDLEFFKVNFILDKKMYDKALNFDIGLLKDNTFKSDIFKIADDMYYLPKPEIKKGLMSKLFNRKGDKNEQEI